jgi:hypothetical protein
MPAVGWARLGQRLARDGEVTGRGRAGEDEAARPQVPGYLQDVAGAIDVGLPVLGRLVAGEVVVAGQVDDEVDTACGDQAVANIGDLAGVGDVGVQPLDVGALGRAGALGHAPRQGEDAMRAPETIQQMATDEPGGARDEQSVAVGRADHSHS